MLLKEFFDKDTQKNIENSDNSEDKSNIKDDTFWYIVNHDKIYKEYFVPLAKQIKMLSEKSKSDDNTMIKQFMPMVEKGCLEYYEANQLTDKISKIFPKEVREELCQKLFDYYYEDIKNDNYKLGLW